jgi:hypothetical protein
MMQPMVDRLELCAKMGLDFVHHPEGGAALAKVIKEMATIIDNEIDRRDSDN